MSSPLLFQLFREPNMHLRHHMPQLDPKPTQYIPLPRVIFRIHPRLHLLIINNEHAKRFLSIRRIKCQPRFLDFCEELLRVRERVPKAFEQVFRLEIPEGLKLEPFADVVFQL